MNPQTIELSLVSHTNVGKTTLARTLVGSDLGSVRDEAHVTESAEDYTLIETPDGHRLRLWDTPGFGDSFRLARRLDASGNPLGWMLGQVWDRVGDRPLFSSQQAVRNVREHADVVLYLVNAAEEPEDAAYVEPEMRILGWIGKPVVVLLNQMGEPRSPDAEAAELERWRERLAPLEHVRAVLALDAFARCWVQEFALFDAIGPLLSVTKREAFGLLASAWRLRRLGVFEASMTELATRIARAASDLVVIEDAGVLARARALGAAIGGVIGVSSGDRVRSLDLAMRTLAERLDVEIRRSTDRLIELHGLEGKAAGEVLIRLAEHYAITRKLDEGKAAALGGLVTGALAGLKADIATGGFTLGGGLIAGGILGALGGAGIARGYNMIRGARNVSVAWSAEVLERLVVSAMLGYLAVAHFGRGRGRWSRSEHPPHWEALATEVAASAREALADTWKVRSNASEPATVARLAAILGELCLQMLERLYPQAVPVGAKTRPRLQL